MIEDYEANGTWDNGKFRPWGEKKEPTAEIIVNVSVQGLPDLEKLKGLMEEIEESTRGRVRSDMMSLDETFSSAGFEHKEQQVGVGMVNRVKQAGLIAFRVATCPFRRKP